jgi:hypothetical protein
MPTGIIEMRYSSDLTSFGTPIFTSAPSFLALFPRRIIGGCHFDFIHTPIEILTICDREDRQFGPRPTRIDRGG